MSAAPFLVPVCDACNHPRFKMGEYALVEPNTEPDPEDDVFVRLVDGRTMIRRLLSRRGVVQLGSYGAPEVITVVPEDISGCTTCRTRCRPGTSPEELAAKLAKCRARRLQRRFANERQRK